VGEEVGSELRVSLHSATVEKSDVFHHNYAVLEDLVDRANKFLSSEGIAEMNINDLSMERLGRVGQCPTSWCPSHMEV